MVKPLDFILGELESHWKVLRRKVKSYDVHISNDYSGHCFEIILRSGEGWKPKRDQSGGYFSIPVAVIESR